MKKSITKQRTKPNELEPNTLYDEEEAMEILDMTKEEFEKLNIPRTEIYSTGEIVYDSKHLLPHYLKK